MIIDIQFHLFWSVSIAYDSLLRGLEPQMLTPFNCGPFRNELHFLMRNMITIYAVLEMYIRRSWAWEFCKLVERPIAVP